MLLSFLYLTLLHVMQDYLLLDARKFNTAVMTYTCSRKSSTFSSTSDWSGRVSSPSIEPEAWLPQRSERTLTPAPFRPAFESSPAPFVIPLPTRSAEPPDPLFEALLHDRGQAYRHGSIRSISNLAESNSNETRSLTRSLTSPWAEMSPSQHHTHMSTVEQQCSRPRSHSIGRESTGRSMAVKAPKVSKRRAGCSTRNATKSKGKSDVASQRKRSAAELGDEDKQKRASKVTKVEAKANIGVKVGAEKASLPEIIELSSDSETGEEPRKSGTVKKERPKTMLLHLKLQQRRKPPANSPAMDRAPPWGHPKADPPNIISDPKPGPTHAIHDTGKNVEEIQCLLRDLQTANEKIHRLEQELEKKEASASLEMQKLQKKHKQEELGFTQGLEDEKARSRGLHEQVQDSYVKHTKLQNELSALRNQHDQEKQERKEERRRHTEVLDDILKPKPGDKSLTEEIEQVQKDNARLSAENISLKAKAASLQNRAILSPVPSSNSSTDEERKEDNIRKIYIKTKRQYDVLQAATKNLLACTRSMDLTCFGEFGSYIAKLRVSLEGEASSKIQQVQVVFKEDEDIGFGSQGSMV